MASGHPNTICQIKGELALLDPLMMSIVINNGLNT